MKQIKALICPAVSLEVQHMKEEHVNDDPRHSLGVQVSKGYKSSADEFLELSSIQLVAFHRALSSCEHRKDS